MSIEDSGLMTPDRKSEPEREEGDSGGAFASISMKFYWSDLGVLFEVSAMQRRHDAHENTLLRTAAYLLAPRVGALHDCVALPSECLMVVSSASPWWSWRCWP